MNLNQLKYFVSVAENRSFTKAAMQYYISQTAITQQVKALEEKIGTPLLDRNTRPISLTPAGKTFLGEAKEILDRMEAAIYKTVESSTGLEGTLKIGYTKGYERSDLINKLSSFHNEYPNILLTFYRCDTDILATGLMNKEYDIIFTWDSRNTRQDSSLDYKVIEHVPLFLAVYRAHPLARKKTVNRVDMRGEKIIFMSPSSTGDSFGDAYYLGLYQQAGYQPDILLNTSDGETVLMMVAAEQAISVVPEYCIDRLIHADNLVYIPLEGVHETEEILAMWRKEDISPALQHFIDHLGL